MLMILPHFGYVELWNAILPHIVPLNLLPTSSLRQTIKDHVYGFRLSNLELRNPKSHRGFDFVN